MPSTAITTRAKAQVRSPASGERRLLERFGAKRALKPLGDCLQSRDRGAGLSAGLSRTLPRRARPPKLAPPVTSLPGTVMAIDPAARASLEIERTLQGQRKGSLFIDAIDRTVDRARRAPAGPNSWPAPPPIRP